MIYYNIQKNKNTNVIDTNANSLIKDFLTIIKAQSKKIPVVSSVQTWVFIFVFERIEKIVHSDDYLKSKIIALMEKANVNGHNINENVKAKLSNWNLNINNVNDDDAGEVYLNSNVNKRKILDLISSIRSSIIVFIDEIEKKSKDLIPDALAKISKPWGNLDNSFTSKIIKSFRETDSHLFSKWKLIPNKNKQKFEKFLREEINAFLVKNINIIRQVLVGKINGEINLKNENFFDKDIDPLINQKLTLNELASKKNNGLYKRINKYLEKILNFANDSNIKNFKLEIKKIPPLSSSEIVNYDLQTNFDIRINDKSYPISIKMRTILSNVKIYDAKRAITNIFNDIMQIYLKDPYRFVKNWDKTKILKVTNTWLNTISSFDVFISTLKSETGIDLNDESFPDDISLKISQFKKIYNNVKFQNIKLEYSKKNFIRFSEFNSITRISRIQPNGRTFIINQVFRDVYNLKLSFQMSSDVNLGMNIVTRSFVAKDEKFDRFLRMHYFLINNKKSMILKQDDWIKPFKMNLFNLFLDDFEKVKWHEIISYMREASSIDFNSHINNGKLTFSVIPLFRMIHQVGNNRNFSTINDIELIKGEGEEFIKKKIDELKIHEDLTQTKLSLMEKNWKLWDGAKRKIQESLIFKDFSYINKILRVLNYQYYHSNLVSITNTDNKASYFLETQIKDANNRLLFIIKRKLLEGISNNDIKLIIDKIKKIDKIFSNNVKKYNFPSETEKFLLGALSTLTSSALNSINAKNINNSDLKKILEKYGDGIKKLFTDVLEKKKLYEEREIDKLRGISKEARSKLKTKLKKIIDESKKIIKQFESSSVIKKEFKDKLKFITKNIKKILKISNAISNNYKYVLAGLSGFLGLGGLLAVGANLKIINSKKRKIMKIKSKKSLIIFTSIIGILSISGSIGLALFVFITKGGF